MLPQHVHIANPKARPAKLPPMCCAQHSAGRAVSAAAIALSLFTTAAQAGAAEFDAYTQGRIILFNLQGTPYGLEHYLPGRRVIWSFLDGQCLYGEWFAQQDEICFLYEDSNTPICWDYEIGSDGLTVSVDSDGDGQALVLNENPKPVDEMLCLGPEVGV